MPLSGHSTSENCSRRRLNEKSVDYGNLGKLSLNRLSWYRAYPAKWSEAESISSRQAALGSYMRRDSNYSSVNASFFCVDKTAPIKCRSQRNFAVDWWSFTPVSRRDGALQWQGNCWQTCFRPTAATCTNTHCIADSGSRQNPSAGEMCAFKNTLQQHIGNFSQQAFPAYRHTLLYEIDSTSRLYSTSLDTSSWMDMINQVGPGWDKWVLNELVHFRQWYNRHLFHDRRRSDL